MNRLLPGLEGFSLVEVTLAIAIVTFAVLSVVALLPLGIRSNQISVEESRAANLLTMLEADLRNTYPESETTKSRIFGLALPYRISSGRIVPNDNLQTNVLLYSTGLNDDDTPTSLAASPRPHFQASVIYSRVPSKGSESPVTARLIVNWPSSNTTSPTTVLTNGRSLESCVTFPIP